MEFKRIKDLRNDKELFQEEIAKILGINRVVYSRYETGVRDIPADLIIKLAKFYKTSTDYILGMTNIKQPYPRKKDR